MTSKFNPARLGIARRRRRMTSKALADMVGISPVTITRHETGQNEPEPDTIKAFARALKFPEEFFFGDTIDDLPKEAASFRSLTAMSAKEREAALAAGSIAFVVCDWIEQRFNLPAADFIDASFERDPESAARSLRQAWGLGEQPIPNMIKLLESRGVRVFSLAENTKNVDAFSCWRGETPYIFLNTFKSPEHSRFDAAHELGHLILHKHGGPQQGRDAEHEANDFGSNFLMPEDDIRARVPRRISLDGIVRAKRRWRVSAAALAYRLHKLGTLSDWHYRSICIEMNRRGFRDNEPESIEREESIVWRKVLSELWSDKLTKAHIAAELHLPAQEIENLMFGLVGANNVAGGAVRSRRPDLRVV